MTHRTEVSAEAFATCSKIKGAEVLLIQSINHYLPVIRTASRLDGETMLLRLVGQRGKPRKFSSLDTAANWMQEHGITMFRVEHEVLPGDNDQ
jgi:hypothetical protein